MAVVCHPTTVKRMSHENHGLSKLPKSLANGRNMDLSRLNSPQSFFLDGQLLCLCSNSVLIA